MKSIILTGGGSAGHCTPNLALIPRLRNYFDRIYYIGSTAGIEKKLVSDCGIPYYSISCTKLQRKLTIKNLAIPFRLLKSINDAGKIIDTLKPNVIFSKGGYVSLPVVIAGHKRKIPIIAHESDLTMGLANKISSKYCTKVLTSFDVTAKSIKNGVFIGSPLRQKLFTIDKEKAINYFEFNNRLPILLIIGGSLGAKAINDVTRLTIDELVKNFNVIHIVGKGNLSDYKNPSYYQTEYMNNVELALNACDICVSRAGSNTIFELLALKKPCLLIPLPKNESRGDQILNANYFFERNLVSVLYQENLNRSTYLDAITDLYKNRLLFRKNFLSYPVDDKSPDIAKLLYEYSRD